MTHFSVILRIALACGLALATGTAGVPSVFAASPGPAAKAPSPRCQVWQRELDFARAVAQHDRAAFAELVHPRAVFGAGRTPTIGRDAVVRDWQGIIDGSTLKLEWYPQVVTIGGDGNIAYSSGPALFRDPATGAYSRSRFGSVWQRDADGAWRVVFDDGSGTQPADAAAVKAFRQGAGARCSEA